MARPVTISEEQLLDAARVIFVRDGTNATTKDIARQAGVGEGSLFRRFPTKEALFSAAILNPPPPAWVRELEVLVGQGDLHANLVRIACGMIHFAQEGLPLVMVAWAGKAEPTSAAVNTSEPPGIRDRRYLTNFLRQEIECGRLRPCNAEAVARMLFGACLNLVMDRLTLRQPLPSEEVQTFSEELVDALWDGIAAL